MVEECWISIPTAVERNRRVVVWCEGLRFSRIHEQCSLRESSHIATLHTATRAEEAAGRGAPSIYHSIISEGRETVPFALSSAPSSLACRAAPLPACPVLVAKRADGSPRRRG